MMSVTAIADLYAYLYSDLPTPAGVFDRVIPVDGAYTAIARIDGIDYVLCRGSTTFQDWIDDFDHFALPVNDPVLGDVHPGAREGVLLVKDQIDALVGDHVIYVGHSLGAMHAALLAGYRVAAGKAVDALIMFGEPRPGGAQLSQILSKTFVQSFRNADQEGHDFVTDVPRALLPLLPYQHVKEPLTDCWRSPTWPNVWGVFAWHHFRLYAEAFGAAGPGVLSLSGG